MNKNGTGDVIQERHQLRFGYIKNGLRKSAWNKAIYMEKKNKVHVSVLNKTGDYYENLISC